MLDERRAWMWSLLATAVFWIALAGCGAARPDYSQLTNAVSELGAVGVPHALAWNLLGFMLPGLLLAASGAAVAPAIDGRGGPLRWLLAGSGVAFAATGIFPAVMRHGSPVMQAPSTVGHIVMLLLSSALWVAAIGVLPLRLRRTSRRDPRLKHIAIVTAIALAGLSANVLHAAIPPLVHRPGLAQRLGFAGYFLWYVVLSLSITRMPTHQTSDSARRGDGSDACNRAGGMGL